MKKPLFSLLLVSFFTFTLMAAETSRFPIKATSVWRINYEYSCMGEDFVHQGGDEEYKYFVDGDTLIGGSTYFKLYKTGILYLDKPFEIKNKYIGAIRDDNNRFYFVESKKNKETLLYNFGAKVGEAICTSESGMSYEVSEIDTLENGRKRYRVDIMTVHCGSANTLIEGIGWLGGLLEGNACYAHPGIRGSYLLCYSENGVQHYLTDGARCGQKMNCDTDFSGVPSALQVKVPEINVLPDHRLEVCLPDLPSTFFDVEIFTVDGTKVFHQISELPGTLDVQSLKNGLFVIRISNKHWAGSGKFLLN